MFPSSVGKERNHLGNSSSKLFVIAEIEASVISPVYLTFFLCRNSAAQLFLIRLKVIKQNCMDILAFGELHCPGCSLYDIGCHFKRKGHSNSGDSLQCFFLVIDIIIYIYYFICKQKISAKSSEESLEANKVEQKIINRKAARRWLKDKQQR